MPSRGVGSALAVVFACVAALGASVLISACGASSKSPDGEGGLPGRAQAQADTVRFAKCMRDHGIKVEVNTSGGAVQMSIGAPGGAHETDGTHVAPPGLQAAQHACQKYMPNEGKPPQLSPAEEVNEREDALKFARCMRSHGIDVTESSSGTIELPSSVTPQAKSFEEAQRDCQGVMGDLPMRMSSRGPEGNSSVMESARVGSGGE